MKVTLEIPKELICGFFNYVFFTETGLALGVKQIAGEDLKDGNLLEVKAEAVK